MTKEDFDRKQWRKDMRCFIEIADGKRRWGTILKVLFGAQAVGVKFDGKDYVERINCERITLEEDYNRERAIADGMKRNACTIVEQMEIKKENLSALSRMVDEGSLSFVSFDYGEITIGLTDGTEGYNHDWLIRTLAGPLAVCSSGYHRKLVNAGLVKDEDYGFYPKPKLF